MSKLSKTKMCDVREAQEKKYQERRRNILYLIHSFLKENFLNNTAESLEKEAHLSASYEVCDNVDFDTILQEYNSFYFSKFGKYPKICRKSSTCIEIPDKKKQNKPVTKPKPKPPDESEKSNEFEFCIRSLSKNESTNEILYEDFSKELPCTLSMINLDEYPAEWKEMFKIILKEIIPKDLGIKWTDCIGMEEIKNLLLEATVYPLAFPHLFGFVPPWKGILLYGPPGTGKTLTAKALACESNTMLINVSPSTFISKWRGESEKLVRVLFEVAQICSPCTVFIDEIDAIASRREEQQHEASRRFKSELLTQMDGILNNNKQIFILASTNLPWEIDSAILRRFDKKIFVDLPNKEARTEMFAKFLINPSISNDNLQNFAEKTENYSGNDIKLICKNAYMSVVRRKIEKMKQGYKYSEDDKCTPTVRDVNYAIMNARSSSACYKEKYLEWQSNFGGI